MPTRDIYNFPLRDQSIRQKSTVAGFPVISRRTEPGQENPRIWHQHDCLEIAVVLSGTAVHILSDQSAPIREGDVLLIGPNLVHGYEECSTLGLYNVLYNSTKLPVPIMDGEDIPAFKRFLPAKFENPQSGYSPSPIAHFPDRAALDQAVWQIDRIHQELTTASLGNMFAGFARLLDFLVTILRLVESTEPPTVPPRQWIFPLEEILAFL
ncbi:MAG: cupin domain-containing protein, partial [Victivallales bacterium]|nr:cupin domain-containing protein [Victivallales bacterium]